LASPSIIVFPHPQHPGTLRRRRGDGEGAGRPPRRLEPSSSSLVTSALSRNRFPARRWVLLSARPARIYAVWYAAVCNGPPPAVLWRCRAPNLHPADSIGHVGPVDVSTH